METKTLIVLACFTVVLLAQESYGIKCYTCIGCNDPFDKNGKGVTTPDCPTGSCIKTKGKDSGKTAVARGCAPAKMDDKCESKSEGGASVTICGCNTDLCNAATTSTISVTAMLSLVVGIFMYKNIL